MRQRPLLTGRYATHEVIDFRAFSLDRFISSGLKLSPDESPTPLATLRLLSRNSPSATYGSHVDHASTLPDSSADLASAGCMNSSVTSESLIPARSSVAMARKWPMEPRVVAMRLPFRSAALLMGDPAGTRIARSTGWERVAATARTRAPAA